MSIPLLAVGVVVGVVVAVALVVWCRSAHRQKLGDAAGALHPVATSTNGTTKADQDAWDAVLAASVTGTATHGPNLVGPGPRCTSPYDNSDYNSEHGSDPASPVYAEPTMAVAAHPNLSAVDFLWKGQATAQHAAVYEAATAATAAGYEVASRDVDVRAMAVQGGGRADQPTYDSIAFVQGSGASDTIVYDHAGQSEPGTAARALGSPEPVEATANSTVTYQASVSLNSEPRPSSVQIRHMKSQTQAPVYDSITFVSGSATPAATHGNSPIYATVDKSKLKRPHLHSPTVAGRRGTEGLSIAIPTAAPSTVHEFEEPNSPGSPRQVSVI